MQVSPWGLKAIDFMKMQVAEYFSEITYHFKIFIVYIGSNMNILNKFIYKRYITAYSNEYYKI